MPWMVSVEGVCHLGVCCAAVVAACYEEVVGGGVCVVGDADLVGAVCGDPFPVVHWNGCSGRVENERGASVVAGADGYVCERWGCGEAGYIDVVFAVGGPKGRPRGVSVSSRGRGANDSRLDPV